MDSTQSSTSLEPKPETVGKPEKPGRPVDASGLVSFMSRLDVADSSVVRATSCHKALSRFGKTLRSPQELSIQNQLFQKSQLVEEIQEFWSHSWHMAPWKKILCLLMLKKGKVAGILSTVAALVGGGLTALGVLPLLQGPVVLGISLWSQIFGTLTFFPTLLWWPSYELVFLDCCCIDQQNVQQKIKALRSMAGILKRSRQLLVIWDPTYVRRFWCIFELAAFLKSHNGADKVMIRPTLLGPFSFTSACSLVVVNLVVSIFTAYDIGGLDTTILTGLAVLLVMYWAASECRSYFHSLEIFREQMNQISLANTSCWCCSVNHQIRNGRTIPCDKEVVSECLRAWFGSLEECESALKAMGADGLASQLGHLLVPFKLMLWCTVPILWLCVDMAVSYHMNGNDQSATHWLIASVGYWFGSTPATAAWLFWVARKLWRPRRFQCVDRMMNFVVLAAMLPVFLLVFGLPSFLENLELMPSWANVTTSTCILCMVGFLTWQLGAKRC